MLLNHSAPLARMQVTQAKVSTLLTIVGLPRNRCRWGRAAGWRLAALAFQRLDQGRLLAADVGPRAHADGDVEIESLPAADVVAQQACLAAAASTVSRCGAQIRVFRPQIDDAVARADDPGADGHALEHQVGELGEDHAVLEGARLAFVGIADDVLAGFSAGQFHFRLVGKPAPPRPFSLEYADHVDDVHAGHGGGCCSGLHPPGWWRR